MPVTVMQDMITDCYHMNVIIVHMGIYTVLERGKGETGNDWIVPIR